ncbi:hypothetical protein HK097_004687, partial [Rhizophlyctis rosea]
ALVRGECALPPVDWSGHIGRLVKVGGGRVEEGLFLLASRQASGSGARSLTNHFIGVLVGVGETEPKDAPSWWREWIPTKEGVGKLLTLGGLVGEDGVQGQIAIAGSKIVEVFKGLVRWAREGDREIFERFLSTLVPHFLVGAGTETGASTTMLRDGILQTLFETYLSLPPMSPPAVVRSLTTLLTSSPTSTLSLLSFLPGSSYAPVDSSRQWTSKELLSLGRCVEVAVAGGGDWVGQSVAGAFGSNGGNGSLEDLEGVLVRVAKEVAGTEVVKDGVGTVLNCVRGFVEGHGVVVGKRWVVKMLDVIIVLCGGKDVSVRALDDGWGMGVGGVVGMFWGVMRGDGREFVVISEEMWRTFEDECVVVLGEVLDGQDDAVKRQTIKRLLRILQCTTTEEGPRTRGRIKLAHHTRNQIVELVLRLRDDESVRENWLDVVE